MNFTVHPARGRPLAVLVVLIVLAAIVYATWEMFFQPLMVLVMAGIFLTHMASFLAPTTYDVTDDGIASRRLGVRHFYPWSRFHRYTLERGGVFLSGSVRKGAEDLLRGVYLVMDKSHRDSLKPVLEAHIGAGQAARERPVPGRTGA